MPLRVHHIYGGNTHRHVPVIIKEIKIPVPVPVPVPSIPVPVEPLMRIA